MRVTALDHIVLNVQDVERSLDFYQRHLGLAAERVEAWRRGDVRFPSVRINDTTIIDLVAVAAPADSVRAQPNLAHFCLVTGSVDMQAEADDLTRAGVAIEEGPKRRSGARGDAQSIYFRDPDGNLIEVRSYGRRGAIQSSLDEAHAALRRTVDGLSGPEAPMPGYDGWSKKDLVAHLTSIETRIRDQVHCAVQAVPWTPEDIDVFNTRQVTARRDWTLDQLRRELEDEAAASRSLLGSLSEDDLQLPFDHPRRGRITVAELWAIIPRHMHAHVADLRNA